MMTTPATGERPPLVGHLQYDPTCYGCWFGRSDCSEVCPDCGCPDAHGDYDAGARLPRQDWCDAHDCPCHTEAVS